MTSALHAEGREFDSHWKYSFNICPRGPTDKASDYESGDCGFESHQGCFFVNALLHCDFKFCIFEKQIEHKFHMVTPLNDTKKFPHRDLNPGLTGESRVS